MPDPILYTILHPYAFHQFDLKIWAETKSDSRTTWKQYTPIHRMWLDNLAETSHGRNNIIGKVNSRLYFDEILHNHWY